MPTKQGYKAPVIKPSSAGLGLVKVRKNPADVADAAPTTRSVKKRKNIQGGPRFGR